MQNLSAHSIKFSINIFSVENWICDSVTKPIHTLNRCFATSLSFNRQLWSIKIVIGINGFSCITCYRSGISCMLVTLTNNNSPSVRLQLDGLKLGYQQMFVSNGISCPFESFIATYEIKSRNSKNYQNLKVRDTYLIRNPSLQLPKCIFIALKCYQGRLYKKIY